jgi:hypothetical protein
MIQHRWESLNNGTQKRCSKCKCIRTKKYSKGEVEITYQDSKGVITENKGCIEPLDLSEFYN